MLEKLFLYALFIGGLVSAGLLIAVSIGALIKSASNFLGKFRKSSPTRLVTKSV